MPGRAEAALGGPVQVELVLEGVGPVRSGQPLHGDHVGPRGLHHGRDARQGGRAVHEDRAGPAVSLVAPLLGAGQPQDVPKGLQEGVVARHADLVEVAVDAQADDLVGGRHETESLHPAGRAATEPGGRRTVVTGVGAAGAGRDRALEPEGRQGVF